MLDQIDITALLKGVRSGEHGATERLVDVLYEELRRIARGKMRGVPPGSELSPTAIVHEVYLELFGDGEPDWENRRHFFFAASRAMRDVMVRHARLRAAVKRGGRVRHVVLEDARDPAQEEAVALLELNEELARLAAEDTLAAQVVELKFFGGLGHEEIGRVLDISPSKAWREWSFAKAWLQERLATRSAVNGTPLGGKGES